MCLSVVAVSVILLSRTPYLAETSFQVPMSLFDSSATEQLVVIMQTGIAAAPSRRRWTTALVLDALDGTQPRRNVSPPQRPVKQQTAMRYALPHQSRRARPSLASARKKCGLANQVRSPNQSPPLQSCEGTRRTTLRQVSSSPLAAANAV